MCARGLARGFRMPKFSNRPVGYGIDHRTNVKVGVDICNYSGLTSKYQIIHELGDARHG